MKIKALVLVLTLALVGCAPPTPQSQLLNVEQMSMQALASYIHYSDAWSFQTLRDDAGLSWQQVTVSYESSAPIEEAILKRMYPDAKTIIHVARYEYGDCYLIGSSSLRMMATQTPEKPLGKQ